MSVEIREAKLSDLNAAWQLDRTSFGVDAWTVMDYIGVFSISGIKKFTALADGKFAGFAAMEFTAETNEAWLMTLAVCPEFRGQGIGMALLKHSENAFPEADYFLNVDVANDSAIRLYLRAGYRQTGVEPSYYLNGHDALVMNKLNSPDSGE